MGFLNDLEIETSVTETENGGRALSSTGDGLLNLFAVLGALRSRPYDVIEKFDDAYNDDADLATKMVFYGRDVRGGLGERTVGRLMLHHLAEINPDVVVRNIPNIVEFGRWDDLFVLFGTECENAMLDVVGNQLSADLIAMREDKPVSLLAKWMPSINTSSRNTVALATKLAHALKMTSATYRKTLSKLRHYIDVVEVKMSANEWEKINYEHVPSKAMSNYDGAFANHDSVRFLNYLNDVKEGKAKINASTLYPYDIIEKLNRSSNDTCELQWKALPNYVEGDNNFLVMADVSGSMMGRPMATSVGLAIYFAERNHGEYAGKFMTFTNDPHLVTIKGNTLADKYRSVTKEVGYNTNLEKAFDVVLSTAVRTHCPQSELPKALIVISDMEIDAWSGGSLTFTEEMRKRFADAGYEMPKLVYWNVDSRHDTFLASKNDQNTLLVSGQSASTFKNLIRGIECSAFEIMEQTLNDERYADVIVPSQLDKNVLY
jgi:hypothetical protein